MEVLIGRGRVPVAGDAVMAPVRAFGDAIRVADAPEPLNAYGGHLQPQPAGPTRHVDTGPPTGWWRLEWKLRPRPEGAIRVCRSVGDGAVAELGPRLTYP